MNTDNKNNLNKRIEEVLKNKTTTLKNAYTKSLEELVEDLNIYQHELEFQNDELQRIQLELEQAKTGYVRLFENAPIGYVIIGPEMDLIDCNQTFKKLLNESHAERECRKKMDFREFIAASDQDKFHLFHAQLLKSKDFAELELELISQHHGATHVEIQGRYIHNESEPRILFSIKDITEQKKAQDVLRKQKNQFETLVNNIPGITYRASNDPARTMLFLSDNAELVLGYGKDELLHGNELTYSSLIYNTDKDTVKEAISHSLASREAFELEYRIWHKDGTIRWIWEKGRGIHNERGELLYIEGFIQDITEMKHNEDQLAGFFHVNIDLMLITNLEATIIKVNGEWEHRLGYKTEEIEQKKFFDFIHPDDIQPTIYIVNQLGNNQEVPNFVNRYRCKDGSYRFFQWRAQPRGKLIYAAARDITEQIEAEKLISDSEAKLRELNLTKDKFFSIIAHDLKNPFSAVLGFSQLLEETARDNDQGEISNYAGIIANSSRRIMDLLNNLLEWSHIQTGRISFNPKLFDLAGIINECLVLFDDNAKQKSITIHKNFPEELHAFADKSMISTVLRNLISNAIKYTREGGQITISSRQTPREIGVSISDTGIGIDPNRLNTLFRIDSSQSTPGTNKEQGSGLGLILCKEFIEKHGGQISAESKTGEGSTFQFTLPLPD